jgi:perosamine synthetase
MGWLDHDRLGFNYRLSDLACAIGLAQLDGSTTCSPTAPCGGWYREALGELATERGLGLPCRTRAATAAAGSCTWSSFPHGVDRDATILALRELGVQSKPYLPAIHLMSFYRERFGHRPGEFPVCEDIAARSVALPFFPELGQGQVARVAEALARVLG